MRKTRRHPREDAVRTDFPSIENIQKAIARRTKAITSTPRTTPGRAILRGVRRAGPSALEPPRIVVISDEPYRKLVYDDRQVPSVLKHVPNSVVITSASKELSLAGQRIGYIAVGGGIKDKPKFIGALVLATRILGFVNAPAVMQKVYAAGLKSGESVDVSLYKRAGISLRGYSIRQASPMLRPGGGVLSLRKVPDRGRRGVLHGAPQGKHPCRAGKGIRLSGLCPLHLLRRRGEHQGMRPRPQAGNGKP